MTTARLYIAIALLGLGFLAGWAVNQYRTDSITLAEVRGAEKVAQAERERESQISKDLEARLVEWDKKQWVVYREKTKIVDRPVYNNTCLDADGVQLINIAKGGPSSEHPDTVPGTPGSPGH